MATGWAINCCKSWVGREPKLQGAHGKAGGRKQDARCKRQDARGKMQEAGRVWSEVEAAFGERVTRGELMSRHTTARVGGPADLFIEAASADDLHDIVLLARQQRVPHFILGGGSNSLVSDKGI